MRFVDSKMRAEFDRPMLHIVIPGICGPLAETQSLNANLEVDRWVKKLSRSTCLPAPANANDVLASIFDINIKDNFPSAAFTLLANGNYDPATFYMHADPVHLRADMDSAVLTSSADLNISDSESSILCETLNQHFHQDGLTFFLLNKNQWFVTSKDKVVMHTTPLTDATGRNINFILPAGEDSLHWKQVLTEAQMLMHSHEVNATRENAAYLTINSLWFHGPGELPDAEQATDASICSNHEVFKGMANHLQCDYIKLPETISDYCDYLINRDETAVNVLHLTELEHLVNYTDIRPWMNQLSDVLDNWVYPVLDFAMKHNIKATLYPCNEKKYQFSKYDILKFWRKCKLDDHVSNY